MVRVVIERRAKEGKNLLAPLREIREVAMKQLGYISGETLVCTHDNSLISVISTWENLKDWKTWQKSEKRAKLDERVEPLLVEPPIVRVFRYLSYRKTSGQS